MKTKKPATHDKWHLDLNGRTIGPMDSSRLLKGLLSGEFKVTHLVSRNGDNPTELFRQSHIERYLKKTLSDLLADSVSISTENEFPYLGVPSAKVNIGDIIDIREELPTPEEHARLVREKNEKIKKIKQL